MIHMKDFHKPDMVDMVTLGERGQVVIPQAMRELVGLKAGDKLMVFVKHGRFIGLLPPDSFRDMVTELTRQLDRIDAIDTNSTQG